MANTSCYGPSKPVINPQVIPPEILEILDKQPIIYICVSFAPLYIYTYYLGVMFLPITKTYTHISCSKKSRGRRYARHNPRNQGISSILDGYLWTVCRGISLPFYNKSGVASGIFKAMQRMRSPAMVRLIVNLPDSQKISFFERSQLRNPTDEKPSSSKVFWKMEGII
jgi:hypothetical protein